MHLKDHKILGPFMHAFQPVIHTKARFTLGVMAKKNLRPTLSILGSLFDPKVSAKLKQFSSTILLVFKRHYELFKAIVEFHSFGMWETWWEKKPIATYGLFTYRKGF
jgi:hypothetical protein